MTNFSNTSLSLVEDGQQHNNTWTYDRSYTYLVAFTFIFSSWICLIGLLGNGLVVYLLGFHIKRSPFTTYILNLAVADFGVLLVFGLKLIFFLTHVESIFVIAVLGTIFMHGASQLLLTAISIDRSISVLFPIWHRCHRPPRLSTIVCAIIWILSCLPSGSLVIHYHSEHLWTQFFFYPLLAGAVLCLPLVTASALILLFKVFCKSRQPRRGRLLTIVLLTLLFFLIFAFPLNAILTLHYFTSFENIDLILYGFLCASLNSCVNPVIYFMVGRKKRGRQRQSLKVVLQSAFEEKEEHKGEGDNTAQIPL